MADHLRTTLETLIVEHRELLIGTVIRIVSSRETAEDLTHDAYLRVAIAAQQRPIRYLLPKALAIYIGRPELRLRVEHYGE